jgi:excisionase family DNA binding protein
MNKKLVSVYEGASVLGLKPKGMRNLIARRDIPSVKVGRLVRIPVEALEEFIARNTIPAKA